MAEKDPSLSQGRGLSNSQLSDKKEKKKERKEKEKKTKKLKKDKSRELQPPAADPPKKKVLIADPGSGAPEPTISSSPSADSRVNVSPVAQFSSVK